MAARDDARRRRRARRHARAPTRRVAHLAGVAARSDAGAARSRARVGDGLTAVDRGRGRTHRDALAPTGRAREARRTARPRSARGPALAHVGHRRAAVDARRGRGRRASRGALAEPRLDVAALARAAAARASSAAAVVGAAHRVGRTVRRARAGPRRGVADLTRVGARPGAAPATTVFSAARSVGRTRRVAHAHAEDAAVVRAAVAGRRARAGLHARAVGADLSVGARHAGAGVSGARSADADLARRARDVVARRRRHAVDVAREALGTLRFTAGEGLAHARRARAELPVGAHDARARSGVAARHAAAFEARLVGAASHARAGVAHGHAAREAAVGAAHVRRGAARVDGAVAAEADLAHRTERVAVVTGDSNVGRRAVVGGDVHRGVDGSVEAAVEGRVTRRRVDVFGHIEARAVVGLGAGHGEHGRQHEEQRSRRFHGVSALLSRDGDGRVERR